MKTLLLKLATMTVAELKKTAISLKDDVTDGGMIVSERVNTILCEKMAGGEFAEFSEKNLW